MRALIVDDSRTVRMILKKIMEQLTFTVEEAEHGRQGLDRLAQGERPDVVLVDWNMPVMDGLEFIKQVRATSAYAGLPILMVTTENEVAQLQLALNAGANEFIMKPFDRDILRGKLLILGLAV